MFPTVTSLLDAMDETLPQVDAADNPSLAGKLRIADLMTRWLRHGERSDFHARFYDEGLSLLQRLHALNGQSRANDGIEAPIDPTERPEYFEARLQLLFRQLVDGQNRLARLPQEENVRALRADLAAWEYGYYEARSDPPRATGADGPPVPQAPRHPSHDAAYAQSCASSAAIAGVRVHDNASAPVRLRDVPRDRADALLSEIIEQLQIVHATPLDAAQQPASADEATSKWLAAWRDYWNVLDIASPGVSRALQLLEATSPGNDAPAERVHGGCDADRILVISEGTVVLDGWGANHWGDPAEDLADLVMVLEDRLPADAVVRAFEQSTGATIPASRLAWFTLFASVKQMISGYGALTTWEAGSVPDAASLATAARQLRPAIAALIALTPATTPSTR